MKTMAQYLLKKWTWHLHDDENTLWQKVWRQVSSEIGHAVADQTEDKIINIIDDHLVRQIQMQVR